MTDGQPHWTQPRLDHPTQHLDVTTASTGKRQPEIRTLLSQPWYRQAVAEKDPYELLGVPRDASDERIRAAYELEINRATRDGAIRYAAELSAAYETISSPQRRALYERHGFTAISERSPGTAAPSGVWRATPQPGPVRSRTRRRGLRTAVLLVVVVGLVVAMYLATRQADGVSATPGDNTPAVSQLHPAG
jgi:hypothetical protein